MNDNKDMKDETRELRTPPDGQERDLLDVPLDERFVEEDGTVLDPTLVMETQPGPAADAPVDTIVLEEVTDVPADDAGAASDDVPGQDGGKTATADDPGPAWQSRQEQVDGGMAADADTDAGSVAANGSESQGAAGHPGTMVPQRDPRQVPLYAATPGPLPQQPPAPTGPSAATIVLGAIVTLVGILALVVGALMDTAFLSFAQLNDLGGYLFAGLGIFLAVVAVVWAVTSAVRKRQ